MDTDRLDNSYHLSKYSESESELEDENDIPRKVVDERKFIIFESALDNLVKEAVYQSSIGQNIFL